MPAASKLTPRQAAFIPAMLASGNATASAIEAGFSVKGASVAGTRMLRNASVLSFETNLHPIRDVAIFGTTRFNIGHEQCSFHIGGLQSCRIARPEKREHGIRETYCARISPGFIAATVDVDARHCIAVVVGDSWGVVIECPTSAP